MKIEETFLENIKEKTNIKNGDKVIIALSGGQDSVVLLSLFIKYRKELNIKIAVAHINHLLRGKESDEDQDFVTALAKKNSLDIFILRENVNDLAKKNSWTLEESGRIVRYSYLNNLLRKENAQKIATAHHLNDQGETIIFHLIRGSGLKGIRGMFFEKENVVRPLLNISKDEIEEYCIANYLEYREDMSNYSGAYTRNKIRQHLLPILKEYNPKIENQLYKLGEIIKEEDVFMENLAREACERIVVSKEDDLFIKEEFLSLHKSLRRRIVLITYEKLIGKYLEFKYVEKIERYLKGDKAKKLPLPNQVVFYYKKNKRVFILAIKRKKPEVKKEYIVIKDLGSYDFNQSTVTFKKLQKVEKYTFRNSPKGYLSFSKLKFPLILRNLDQKDSFKVVGEKEERSLKHLLASRGYGSYNRRCFPVIVDTLGRIVFVPFIGISDYFILEEKEGDILEIEYKK